MSQYTDQTSDIDTPKQEDPLQTDVSKETPPQETAEVDNVIATELRDTKDRLLRALAEMENLRKRHATEVSAISQYAISTFAKDILGVLDNLNRALESVQDASKEDKTLQSFFQGVELTQSDLIKILTQHNITEIPTEGETFDCHVHQAVAEVESDLSVGKIVACFQKGYKIKDRLLRSAVVSVVKQKENKEKVKNEDNQGSI